MASGSFAGEADNAILLGFESTINPQNVFKTVWAIFEKTRIF